MFAEAETIGTLLRHFRLLAKLTQEALAERAGVSVRAVSDLERGIKTRPHAYTVDRLARGLGLSDSERNELREASRKPRFRNHGTSTRRTPIHPTNLRHGLTSFIGRAHELVVAADMLRGETVRLLTLTGPGGTGKTRLSQHIGQALLPSFDDGVFFVSLAPIDDPALVVSAIAGVIGLRESGERPLCDELAVSLQDKEILLVLDNFEHVLAAGSDIVTLLERCEGLRALITSREPLHMYGEHQLAVAPLPVPIQYGDVDDLQQWDSIALFCDRARAVRPDFQLSPTNSSDVVEVCRKLDGLPLALELAAARIQLLSPEALRTRLDAPLDLLRDGPQNCPARQQSVRADIDWSHALLSADERRMFRTLSVFVGTWSLRAATVVFGESEPVTLDLLTSLLDKSLVACNNVSSGEPQFRMLESLREYGQDQLEAHAETSLIRQAHAEYYGTMVVQAAPELIGSNQAHWMAVLDDEHGNLRAALGWAVESADADLGFAIVEAIWRFWAVRGHHAEGRRWTEALLAVEGSQSPAVQHRRAEVLWIAGAFALAQRDYPRAVTHVNQSLTLFRSLHDATGIGRSLNHLGGVELEQGNPFRAYQLHEEALRHLRQSGNTIAMARALLNMGDVLRVLGELGKAADYLEESTMLMQSIGHVDGIAQVLVTMAEVRRAERKFDASETHFRESMVLYKSLHNKAGLAMNLEGMAAVAAALNQEQRAAQLLGLAESLRGESNVPRQPSVEPEYDALVTSVRDALGEVDFVAAQSVGRGLSLEHVLASLAQSR
ncbi:MAG: hypothetical protein NVSMB52_15760 [Chloroflexota bacterium]